MILSGKGADFSGGGVGWGLKGREENVGLAEYPLLASHSSACTRRFKEAQICYQQSRWKLGFWILLIIIIFVAKLQNVAIIREKVSFSIALHQKQSTSFQYGNALGRS